MKKFHLLFFIAAGMFFFSSCTKDEADPKPDLPCDADTTKITWCSKIKAIVTPTCAISGCHVSGFGSGDFTSFAGVKLKIDAGAFKTRVITNGDMPPSYSTGPTLSSSDKQLIDQWLNNGAPEN